VLLQAPTAEVLASRIQLRTSCFNEASSCIGSVFSPFVVCVRIWNDVNSTALSHTTYRYIIITRLGVGRGEMWSGFTWLRIGTSERLL
jgi:hypothetical protein